MRWERTLALRDCERASIKQWDERNLSHIFICWSGLVWDRHRTAGQTDLSRSALSEILFHHLVWLNCILTYPLYPTDSFPILFHLIPIRLISVLYHIRSFPYSACKCFHEVEQNMWVILEAGDVQCFCSSCFFLITSKCIPEQSFRYPSFFIRLVCIITHNIFVAFIQLVYFRVCLTAHPYMNLTNPY